MVPLLLAMADARPELLRTAHPDLVTGLRLLQNWNLSADRESTAMAYYNIWWALMKKRHLGQFGSEAGLYQGLLANSSAAQEQALDAAVEAARIMRNDFGGLSMPWGNLHRIHRGTRNEAVSGTDTGDPIFFMDNQSFVNRQWHTNFGYGFAMAVQFGEKTQAASIVPFGASEDGASPHFGDQMNLFLERRMKRTRFQYDAVIRHAASGYGTRVVLGSPGLEGYCAILSAQPQEAKLEAITSPPGPIPAGQVAFSPAFRPLVPPSASPHRWEVQLFVPEELCAPEFLSRLQIHTHTLEAGWRPLVGQHFDSALGAFVGQGEGAVIIAILGPTEVLKTPETTEGPDTGVEGVPADGFLRSPLPLPVMDGAADQSETANAAAAPGAGEAGVPAEAPKPEKPLYEIEYMDTPGDPPGEVVPGAEAAQGGEPVPAGSEAVAAPEAPVDGKKVEKPAEVKKEEKPRKAKKIRRDDAPRTRAPRTNFN
jgi:hypothetical protein